MVFDNLDFGYSALHLPATKNVPSSRRLKSVSTQLLILDNSQRYLGPFHSAKPAFDAAFSEQVFDDCQTYVVSDERLSGNPHSGGFDRVTNCLKLKEVLPQAKIFMVYRNQATMIRSCYHQYLVAGGSLPLVGYLRMRYGGIVPTFSLDYFRYDQLLTLYTQHFGADNVLALPYELFTTAPEVFWERVQQFSGANAMPSKIDFGKKVNKRANPWLLVKLRWLNRLARQADFYSLSQNRWSPARWFSDAPLIMHLKSAGLLAAQKTREMQVIEAEIEGYYQESNRKLEALTGMPLAEFGYQ